MNEDQSLPKITIDTESGRPYVSVIDGDSVIGIQLHDYTSQVVVYLDKKCVPDLIQALQKMTPRKHKDREIKEN